MEKVKNPFKVLAQYPRNNLGHLHNFVVKGAETHTVNCYSSRTANQWKICKL